MILVKNSLFSFKLKRKNTTSPNPVAVNVVFFSFSESDRHFVLDIKHEVMDPHYTNLNFMVQDLMERLRTQDPAIIRQIIAKAIKNSSRSIVFVGKDTYRDQWVEEEVKMTIAEKKPVYAIRIKGTHGLNPLFLTNNNIHIYPWHEENLQYLATRED